MTKQICDLPNVGCNLPECIASVFLLFQVSIFYTVPIENKRHHTGSQFVSRSTPNNVLLKVIFILVIIQFERETAAVSIVCLQITKQNYSP